MEKQNDSAVRSVRVSGESHPAQVAGAIAGILREEGHLLVRAMGALAVNQAIKATAVARKFMQEEACDLSMKPSLDDDNGLTVVVFEVTKIG